MHEPSGTEIGVAFLRLHASREDSGGAIIGLVEVDQPGWSRSSSMRSNDH